MWAAPWMDLEGILLGGGNWPRKTAGCMLPVTGNVQERQVHGDENRIRGCQGLGVGGEWVRPPADLRFLSALMIIF